MALSIALFLGVTAEAACNCSGNYAGNYIVNTSKLPLIMRSGHGSNYAKIASIPKGAKVYVSASNGSWAHVNYNGRNGYASMQYLKKVSQQNTISSGVLRGVENATKLNATIQVKDRIYWMKSNLNGYKTEQSILVQVNAEDLQTMFIRICFLEYKGYLDIQMIISGRQDLMVLSK